MGVTSVKRIQNRSTKVVTVFDMEDANAHGHGVPIAPGDDLDVDMKIPFATSAEEFGRLPKPHHLQLKLEGGARYWIWQAEKGDGDFVRVSTTPFWHDPGERVHGVPAV